MLIGTHLELPADCALRCAFCCYPHGRPVERLDLVALDHALAALRPGQELTLGGNDPAAHPQVTEVVALALRRGLRVRLQTPNNPAALALAAQAPPGALGLNLAIYGTTANEHDATVGVAGNFAQLVRLAREAACFIEYQLLLTGETLPRAERIYRFVALHLRGAFAPRLMTSIRTMRDAPYLAHRVSARRALETLRTFLPDEELTVFVEANSAALTPCVLAPLSRREPLLDRYYEALDRQSASHHALRRLHPCPHAGRCAGADACPGVEAVTAESGATELVPLAAPLATPRHREVVRRLATRPPPSHLKPHA